MSVNNIRNFIAKYKNTDKIWEAYCEFDISWLDEIHENLKGQVSIEWDCMTNECRYGDGGEYDFDILNDFIKALEIMLNLLN